MNEPKNETLRSIHQRHSVRMFNARPAPREELDLLLDAANQAPSAHNQQSWRFIVLGEAKKHALAELVNRRSTDFPRPSSTLLRMASRTIQGAPAVIAVANTGDLSGG